MVLLAGLKHFEPVEVVSDLIPLKALTVIGGAGSTAASTEAAVALLNAGSMPTKALRGEVFTLDDIADAVALLGRERPDHDAVRVGLVHA
jgi:threonine dehydrogenase-like Zn-dependent dehydrogenase